jgi:uncharacterized protein with HEPN domain
MLELLTHIYDAREACCKIKEFIRDVSMEEYLCNELIQSAVERKFIIIGEALNKAYNINPDIETEIPQLRDIVNFRNIVVHGYAVVKNETVWDILKYHLNDLENNLTKILTEKNKQTDN